MEERSDAKKLDEIMLPGFRFHPTDEELVGFYLKRKIQQLPLSIEVIKQLDIYKYDPWDLPKFATTGEREWYFYCPRDRKYRNSARPNRVTGAGFWKATGTDRPIYSSLGSNCIGLKKSLVFYKGRAAKGIKTDWMMHEFRLPSLSDSVLPKKFMDKNIPPNDSLAICRIFKKANSTTQRTLSHSWVSPILPQTITSDLLTQNSHTTTNQFSLDNIPSKPTSLIQYENTNYLQDSSTTCFSPLYLPPHKPISNGEFTFLSPEISDPTKCNTFDDFSTMFGDFGNGSESLDYSGMLMNEEYKDFSVILPQELEENFCHGEEMGLIKEPNEQHLDDQRGTIRSIGLPLRWADEWKTNLLCNSSPSPSEMSTTYKQEPYLS